MSQAPCPNCGAVLPAGAKFCPTCGASTGPRSDERRVVTVLFADVVGFTPLSEERDPEHVKNLLDRCFDRLASEISSHGGRVDKIVGDEIMAVFGAPVAHEDDPERAVRAALQMQRNLLEHAVDTGADVRMRIGINTGEVLVGGLRAGGDVTALGDVVNVAKRLQTSAQPGQVLVGQDTHDATSQVIAYTEIGALTVKGRGGLVGAWQAIEALGPPGARIGRARTPLVGRKSELALLWHALGTAVDHGRPHLVLLVGEAGMGKTVLVEEAIEMARVQHDALIIEGRCLPYGEANPWWPIAEALRQACGIEAEDPADEAVLKTRKAIGALVGSDDEGVEAARVSDALMYLMGYEGKLHDVDPQRAREEVTRAIQVSLAANAKQRPLVIVLSELHWADQLVLDLVDSMFERLRNLPIVLLTTARPELEERWTPRPGRHNLFVVNLDPLSRHETADVVRKLLGTEPTVELLDFICDRSGGNPLYITELIAMIGESGSIGVLAQRMEGAELPATLRGLVAARLDGLDRVDRGVLEDAAVVGRVGPIGAVKALGHVRGEVEPHARLTSLQNKDFLNFNEGEFEFRSDLVRDVAYETLTKSDRARRHAAVAEWLVEYSERTEREEEHLERIAHHFAQAAALAREVGSVGGVPQDVLDRALEWIQRAAARAEQRESTAVSLHLMEHALDLVDEGSDLRARFLVGRAKGRAAARDIPGAMADTEEVMEIGERSGVPELCAQAMTVRGEIEQRAGDLEASSATLERAVSLWQETGDRAGEAEALRLWGFTNIHRGHLDEAESAISEALSISRAIGDRRGEAWALQNLAWAAFSRGDNDLAEERLLIAAKMFQEIGDFGGQGWATGLLAYVHFFKGRLEEAGRIAENSLDWTRETGDRWAYGMMLNLLAGVRMWQGRTLESRELARQSNRLFSEIDDKMGLVFSGLNLASAAVVTGEVEEGISVAMNLMPLASEVFAGGFAGILTATSMHAIAGDHAASLAIIERHPHVLEIGAGHVARALALFLAGDGEAAYIAASTAWAENPTEAGERANFGCVLALSAAAAGRPEEAFAAATEVFEVGGSYLDRVRANLAVAFAHAQLEEPEATAAALEAARGIIDVTDDEAHKALVKLAGATISGALGTDYAPEAEPINVVRDRLEQLSISWRAWERAFRTAATSQPAVTAPSSAE